MTGLEVELEGQRARIIGFNGSHRMHAWRTKCASNMRLPTLKCSCILESSCHRDRPRAFAWGSSCAAGEWQAAR